MNRTRTTETAHRTVEYETVACANCSAAVLVEEAVRVVLGGDIEHHYQSIGAMRLDGEHLQPATLCPFCADAIFDYNHSPGVTIEADGRVLEALGRVHVPEPTANPVQFLLVTLGVVAIVTPLAFALVTAVLTVVGAG